MSLIDHTDFDLAKRAALFEDRRSVIAPYECDRGQHCYVRDGVIAYQKASNGLGYCTGCRGKIRAYAQPAKH